MATDLISIRPALLRDAPCLARVHEETWRATYQGIIPHLPLSRMITRHDTLFWEKAIFRSRPILVLEYDSDTVAYSTFGPSRMRGSPFDGEIYELYVRPEFQGVGFGTKLFKAVRTRLAERHLNGLVVWALADNDMACAFYLQRGGQPVSEGMEPFGDISLRKVAYAWR